MKVLKVLGSGGRIICITKGYKAIVDEEDYVRISSFKWNALESGHNIYAKRKLNGRTILMHRVVLKAQSGEQIDHIDGNGLNNSKSNLRIASSSQNVSNSRKFKRRTSSQFKGVSFRNSNGKWVAGVKCKGKRYFIGTFKTEIEAAKAYDSKAIELFGEFAGLNFSGKAT